ncbi:unnamed protein product, partial [marine sediment metagenome]
MHSDSMDNFWLVQAVKFGIPGFATLAGAVLLLMCRRRNQLGPEPNALRLGWTVSMTGLIVAG